MVEPVEPIKRAHEAEPVKKVRLNFKDSRLSEGDQFQVSYIAKVLQKAVEEAKKDPGSEDRQGGANKAEDSRRQLQARP